jgi:hypothetical protein
MLNQVDLLFIGIKSKVVGVGVLMGLVPLLQIEAATMGDVFNIAQKLTLTGALVLAVWYFMKRTEKERDLYSQSIKAKDDATAALMASKQAEIMELKAECRRLNEELLQAYRWQVGIKP